MHESFTELSADTESCVVACFIVFYCDLYTTLTMCPGVQRRWRDVSRRWDTRDESNKSSQTAAHVVFTGIIHRRVRLFKHSSYTVNHKKTCHFVFDYNSSVSFSIFMIFIPVETERNTLKFTYLMAWWRHNTVTTHIIKVYFIQLVLKIKYVVFEDRPIFIKKNL